MVVIKVVSKIWRNYVIYMFADQHKLPEIMEFATLNIIFYLHNDEKLNYYENNNLPVQFMNVVHTDGIKIEDTEESIEKE